MGDGNANRPSSIVVSILRSWWSFSVELLVVAVLGVVVVDLGTVIIIP